MGAGLDIKALTADIKSTVDASLDAKLKGVVKTDDLKPIVDRITELETKGRERPPFAGGDPADDKTPTFKGVPVRPLYDEDGVYKGAIGIPNMTPKQVKAFKFVGVLRGLRTGRWDGFGLEKEVYDEVVRQKAALQLGDDTAAGFYIPNEIMPIIDPLRPTAALGQLGVQTMTGLTASPIEFPRQVGVETAYMVGEDTAITESNQTSDMIKLAPHMAAVLTSATASLLSKAPGVVESRIRRSITRTLELKKDQQFFEGTGVSPNVLGISLMSGINTASWAGVTSTDVWEKAQDAIKQLEVDNDEITGGKFVMHALAWHKLWQYQIQRSAAVGQMDKFLTIEPGMNGVPMKKLMGYPVVICNTIAASAGGSTIVYFGNWPEVMWAEWLNPGIAFTDSGDDAFRKVKGYFRILSEFDANAEHPEAIYTGTAFAV